MRQDEDPGHAFAVTVTVTTNAAHMGGLLRLGTFLGDPIMWFMILSYGGL